MLNTDGQKHSDIAEQIAANFDEIIGKRDQLVAWITALKTDKTKIEGQLSRAEYLLARLDEATPKKEPF